MLLNFWLALFGGGLGLFLLNPLWVWYWRDREYHADHFAAELGFTRELIEYLEQHKYFDAAVPYFMSDHPYTELRIDQLMGYLEGEQGEAEATRHCTQCGAELKINQAFCTSCGAKAIVDEVINA